MNGNKFAFTAGILLFGLAGALFQQLHWSKPIQAASVEINQPASKLLTHPQQQHDEPIYLESMEDLEHVAYLSLRNFNLTDENLEQSNPSFRRDSSTGDDQLDGRTLDEETRNRQRLVLMLESFIYHLRKDHLRRIELQELESMASSMDLTSSLADDVTTSLTGKIQDREGKQEPVNDTLKHGNLTLEEGDQLRAQPDRCFYLVHMYRRELEARDRLSQQLLSASMQNWVPEVSQSASSSISKNQATNGSIANSSNIMSELQATMKQQFISRIPDTKRLFRLCRLVVDCQSAEDFLNMITGPWHDGEIESSESWPSETGTSPGDGSKATGEPMRVAPGGSELEQEDLSSMGQQQQQQQQPAPATGSVREPKSLRESLSRSLAKLCPLILFQLHDSEGHCTTNRDDRPPLMAVWTFATLFVTIVSFCSLIGLSITPLLGQPTEETDSVSGRASDSLANSQSSSSSSDSSSAAIGRRIVAERVSDKQSGRACLILFEGLAVGSLVGSALFSLIPQAFELQDRESNQGFLFKSLIIFFGIYLFFCSERIMRIILDTRQQRKRAKKANQVACSTSMALQNSLMLASVQQVHEQHQQMTRTSSTRDRLNWRNQTPVYEEPERQSSLKPDRKRVKPNGTRSANQKTRNLPVINGEQEILNNRKRHKKSTRKRKTRYQASDSDEDQLARRHQHQVNQEADDPNDWVTSDEIESGSPDEDAFVKTSRSVRARTIPNIIAPDGTKLQQVDKRFQIKDTPHSTTFYPSEWVGQNQQVSFYQREQMSPVSFRSLDVGEQDISTVAWMIVLGDGLHNFIDGISIGAAFSESILSGVSISVAVICEEFPHELGDFAVLVSSGMTVRQALGYNFLSACTCYLGMAFGIILGDVDEGASYISALAAGVFLYIALVDMMGELSAILEKSSRGSLAQTLNLLFLQNVGIFIGISIIFVLSFIDF